MESRNTKQRLDELYDLLKAKYITESEFRIARANIFREGGIDISSHQDGENEEEEVYFDEPEPRGRGCGCFLAVVFLLVSIVIGTIAAVPEWPDNLGGQHARTARAEMLRLWNAMFPPDEGSIPDPLLRDEGEAPAVMTPTGMAETDGTISADARKSESPALVGASAAVTVPETPVVPERTAPVRSDAETASNDVVSSEPGRVELPVVPETPNPVSPEEHGLPPSPEIGPAVLSGGLITREEPEVTVVEIPPAFPAGNSGDTREQPAGIARGFVSGNSARVRSAPDTSDTGNVLGWGRKGDRFIVLEQGADRSGGVWYRVRFEESTKEGWISGALVRVER
ncbi:MAG: SH3 domain-containing protein [Synergistaceae bacterium]|nr:SH3 domain-containing protein [Synergistaceae bacterium]